MTNKEIGLVIKQYRKLKQYNQAKLAKEAQLSTPTISLIENGEHTARQSTIDKLSAILGIPKEKFERNVGSAEKGAADEAKGLTITVDRTQFSNSSDNSISDEMRFPLGLMIGDFHVFIEPALKKDILKLIYWSVATGIISREDLEKIV